MPLISILIPSKNSMDYYSECILSALRQTLSDIEILCIDAQSDDGTRELILDTAQIDPRVRLIDSDKASYGYQINQGIAQAQGEFIMILESDDYLEQDAVQYYYNLITKHDLDFVRSDHDLFKGEGDNRSFSRRILSSFKGYYNKVMNPSQTVECMYLTNLMQSGMFRRSFLVENNINLHETPGASYQDAGFWWQAYTQAERVMFTKDIKYHLRRDNPNSSVLSKDKVFAICDEYDFIHDYLIKNDLHRFLGMCAKRRFDNYQWNAKRIGDWHRPAFFERFAEDFRKLRDNNELDRTYFSPRMWNRINLIIDLGAAYYWNEWHHLRRIDALKASNKKLTEQIETHNAQMRKVKKAAAQQKKIWRDALIETENELVTLQNSKEYQRALKLSSVFSNTEIVPYKSKIIDLDNATASAKRKAPQDTFKVTNPFSGGMYSYVVNKGKESLSSFLPMICSKRKAFWPNLKAPQSYTEIALSRRLDDPYREVKMRFSDVIEARTYAGELIGKDRIMNCLGVWDSPDNFAMDALPYSCVVRCNQSDDVEIVIHDKRLFSLKEIKQQLKKWNAGNFAFIKNYNLYLRDTPKRYYAEDLLMDENVDNTVSFWFFNGALRFIQVAGKEDNATKCSCFDPQGELMLFSLGTPNHDVDIDASALIERLGAEAQTLALEVDHCIVSFKKGKDGVHRFCKYSFGAAETFTAWRPTRADYLVGAYWDITS